jgi:hypothetical protein
MESGPDNTNHTLYLLTSGPRRILYTVSRIVLGLHHALLEGDTTKDIEFSLTVYT